MIQTRAGADSCIGSMCRLHKNRNFLMMAGNIIFAVLLGNRQQIVMDETE